MCTLTINVDFLLRGPAVHFEQSLTGEIIIIVPHTGLEILCTKHLTNPFICDLYLSCVEKQVSIFSFALQLRTPGLRESQ